MVVAPMMDECAVAAADRERRFAPFVSCGKGEFSDSVLPGVTCSLDSEDSSSSWSSLSLMLSITFVSVLAQSIGSS